MKKHSFRRKTHKLLTLTLGLLLLTFFNVSKSNERLQTHAWSGTQTSNYGSYYDSVSTETGSALKSKLKTIISSPTPTVSYDWSRYEAADEAEGISDSVLLIYSRQVVKKSAHVSGSTGWNREHTYPQSKIGSPATSDNHHIFADDNKTNNTRGNKLFGELDPSTATKVYDGYGNLTNNYTNSTYFMPNPEARGEVARATMYLNTLYNYSVTGNFQSTALMLKWHLENPVNDREIYRNNYIHTVQKNRNPFIDKPEYACLVWGGENSATQSICGPQEDVDVTSVSLSPTSATISLQAPNKTLPLSATVLPANATNKALSWSSSNTAVATVSSSGIVSAHTVGTTTITATSVDNPSKSASATITVTNDPIAVTGISFDNASITLKLYNEQTLNPVITPSSATNKNVNWHSSNNDIVTVTNTGLAVGMGVGSATISATTVDGAYSASITVNVINPPPVSSVTGTYYNGNDNNSGGAPTRDDINTGKLVGDTNMPGFGKEVVSELSASQAYFGRGGGISIGSNKNPGFLKLTLMNEYATKRVEVLFNDTNLASTPSLMGTEGTAFTVTEGSVGAQHSKPSTGTPYVIEFPTETTYFEIHATKRIAIVEIAIIIDAELEVSPEVEAKNYSTYFLDATALGCTLSDEALLFSAWEFAEDEYDDLSFIAKTIMQNSEADASSSDVVKQAKARYNFIYYKYNFHDFISGETFVTPQATPPQSKNSLLILFFTALIVVAVVGVVARKTYH